jgi:hypothetical protein
VKRRLALQRVALMVGGAISAPSLAAILNSCKSPSDSGTSAFTFDADQKSLVAEIAEVIIPKTDTPGAKDLNVQDVIEILLKDCYPEEQQKHFAAGLKDIEAESKKVGGSFATLDSENKLKVLEIMRTKAAEESEKNAKAKEAAEQIDSESGAKKVDHLKKDPPTPFFTIVRDLTIFGYYSSEHGVTKEFNYLPVPGRFEGCVTIGPGTKAFS